MRAAPSPRLLLDAATRRDFFTFLQRCFLLLEPGIVFTPYWYLGAMAEVLRRVECGEVRRQIINIPPRSGKSITVTVAFTAYLLGRDPRMRIIVVTHSEDLAKVHAAAFRTIIHSAWFRRVFPALQIAEDRALETVTTKRGFRYAVSMSGSVLGRGADLIIGDDAMGPMAAISEAHRLGDIAIWNAAHRTRLNDKKKGAIVLVSQRLHEMDLVGHVCEKENWEKLIIPAVCDSEQRYPIGPGKDDVYIRAAGEVLSPDREPIEVLEEMRAVIGPMNYSAQYLQDPIPSDGNLLKRDWLRYYESDQLPPAFEHRIASWDTASTLGENSSFTVGTLWGTRGEDIYLLDLIRGKYETPELRELVAEQNRSWNPQSIYIEDTELGRGLRQDLQRMGDSRATVYKPRFDKVTRFALQCDRFRNGRVYLPASAPWINIYVSELLSFPQGRHNDQVDLTSQALDVLTALMAKAQPLVRRNPVRKNVVRR